MSELKPCPFCGGEPEIERPGSARQSMIIACTDCGGRMESGDVVGLTQPKHWAWNNRAAPPDDELAMGERECVWRSENLTSWDSEEWSGGCGVIWQFTEDGPIENEVHFCMNCGGKVRIKEQDDE